MSCPPVGEQTLALKTQMQELKIIVSTLHIVAINGDENTSQLTAISSFGPFWCDATY